MKLLAKDLRYFIKLLITTPNYGMICSLQLLSGLTSFLGLPLLIPVLELMQGSSISKQSHGYLKIFLPFFKFFGLEVNFGTMLCLAAVLILAGQALASLSSFVTVFVRENLLADYRKKTVQLYFSADWQWLTDHHSGRMYHAVVAEVNGSCDAHMNAQRVFINFFQLVIFWGIALRLSWQVTCLAIGMYILIGLLNSMNLRQINRLSHASNLKEKEFTNEIVGFQHNKKFIKVALLEGMIGNSLTHMLDVIRGLRKKVMAHMEMQRVWSMMSTTILLIVLIAFNKVFGLNYATLLLMLFVFLRMAPLFVAVSDLLGTLESNIPTHKSLQEHLNSLEDHQEKNGIKKFQPDAGMSCEHLSFAYPGQPDLFSDLSFSIKPKTMVAFVGPSGVGKSTILDLLLGLYEPKAGVIYYGDVPHVDLDKNSFREVLGFVGQRPSLLSGTLRENLIVANVSIKDEDVWEICRQVHLKEFIEHLPKGLDTMVGENGIKLSGGQRQRVALARCLLTRPKILILDEATSELDMESEAVIQRSLKELRSAMTTIIVAHRLSTVKGADKIYVIDRGGACESGTYEELMAKRGRFFTLASVQN